MKKLALLSFLLLVSGLAQAATLILDSAPGLRNGFYSIKYHYKTLNGAGDINRGGLCYPAGFPAWATIDGAIDDINNNLSHEKDLSLATLDVTLTCKNNRKTDYHFELDRLVAPGTIILSSPTGCA